MFFLSFFFCFSNTLWEICGPITAEQTQVPLLNTVRMLGGKDFGNTTKRPLRLLCVTFLFFFPYVCVHASVRGCVTTCAWLQEGVKLDSKILYNTAYICRGRELTHELNLDKEQIYLKWLCYISWTTVDKLFFDNSVQKMNLGNTYMTWYICICIMQKRNHDGHLTFYLLLSGFIVEIIRFLVFLFFDILPCVFICTL